MSAKNARKSGNKAKQAQKNSTVKKQKGYSSTKVADKRSATLSKKKKKYTKEEMIRKQLKIKRTVKWSIIVLILIGICIFLFTSDMFEIIEIKISGTEQVEQEELPINDKIGKNIFLLTKSKIRNDLKQNPYIKYVYIKKILPNKLQITIEERQKDFLIKDEDGYLYLDNQGYVVGKSNIKLDKILILGTTTTGLEPGKKLNDKDIEKLEKGMKIIECLEGIELKDKITSIDIYDEKEYKIYLEELKKIIYIGDTSNLANKALYIKAIIKQEEGKEGKIFVNGDFAEGFEAYFREEANQVNF